MKVVFNRSNLVFTKEPSEVYPTIGLAHYYTSMSEGARKPVANANYDISTPINLASGKTITVYRVGGRDVGVIASCTDSVITSDTLFTKLVALTDGTHQYSYTATEDMKVVICSGDHQNQTWQWDIVYYIIS